MSNEYYVYQWYHFEYGYKHVFHVGKGKNDRYISLGGRNKYFLRVIKKYCCNVEKIVTNISEDDAFKIEKSLIYNYWDVNQCETNFHEGGKGGNTTSRLPDKVKNEICLKRSISGKKLWEKLTDEEYEYRCSLVKGENNPMYGIRGKNHPSSKKRTEEQKQNMSIALKGRKFSEEHKQNISNGKKGSIPWNKDKKLLPLSNEHKQKISNKLKGQPCNNGLNKRVCCEGIIYNSIGDAAKVYNISVQGMGVRLNSKTEKMKEFYFIVEKKPNDYPEKE